MGKLGRIGVVLCVCAILGWLGSVGCSNNPTTETTDNDATAVKEETPEPIIEQTVAEPVPEKPLPPEGLGEACQISPVSQQGTCKSKGLLCGAVDDKNALCFENCSSANCTIDGEQCVTVDDISNRFPICVKVAKTGETCDLKSRTVCRGTAIDPPEFCVGGKCTQRPKDGWSLGQNCTFDPRNDQGDCIKNLICVEHAKEEYRCAKACNDDKDCTGGEVCGTDLGNKKACVIIAKIGEPCSPSERKFCRTTDPNNPVRCQSGVCRGSLDLKQLDEACAKSLQPGQVRGDCDQNLLCLGVSSIASKCHKECKSQSDCPTGESCMLHPNEGPGDPLRACVKPVPSGGTCDLTKRLMCEQPTGKFFKCDRKEKPDGNFEDEGTCLEIVEGAACKTATDCGAMLCITIAIQNAPPAKNCMLPCDPQTPCPKDAACQSWGQNGPTACLPVGPKKEDEVCARFAPAEGKNLDTANYCVGGFQCVGLGQSAQGVCMQAVAQCSASACKSPGHVCLPTQGGGFCALDCSTNANVCKTGTKCQPLSNPKATICAP